MSNLQPDLMAACPLIAQADPETLQVLQEAMRDAFNHPGILRQAKKYRYDADEFIDLLVVTYSNRLVTECS